MTRNASENVFGDNSYEHQQLRKIDRALGHGHGESPYGWFWPILLLAVLALSFFLPRDDKAEPWNPRPAILEHAFKLHPKLDATDLDWSGPEPLAGTSLETWVLEGPYDWGWLTTSWTVDREQQTVHMDWSRTEELKR